MGKTVSDVIPIVYANLCKRQNAVIRVLKEGISRAPFALNLIR